MISKENSFTLKKILLDWVVPIVAAIILAKLINAFVVFKVSIPSESMFPTIKKGDQIFVTKVYNINNIKRGDIVVFDSKELNDMLIKRVVGLPGDKVEVKEDGEVYINGQHLVEDYVKNHSDKTAEFQVPEGKFLMLGDNRSNSLDARYWNNPYIDGSDIKGTAKLRVYPFDRVGFVR